MGLLIINLEKAEFGRPEAIKTQNGKSYIPLERAAEARRLMLQSSDVVKDSGRATKYNRIKKLSVPTGR